MTLKIKKQIEEKILKNIFNFLKVKFVDLRGIDLEKIFFGEN
ncbi:MAG: hypothetical protein CM15mP22_1830 [Gammaproteobacteria bacterium]|nr:MAG: hypothetical protein CM15mP22_1830 [Gammaproteobacteria bacterium]